MERRCVSKPPRPAPTVHSLTILLGVLVLLGGLAAITLGAAPPGWIFLIQGAFVVAAVVFERYRYKPLIKRPPSGNWVRTQERFVDEETGATVTVYLNPVTGERQYVRE